jgi:LemA protein
MDKKWLIGCGGAAVIVLIFLIGIYSWGKNLYNGFVTREEQVNQAWSQVENQYQRRFDLIPNLVSTVQGVAQQEKDLFIGIAEARAKVGSMTVTKEVLDNPDQFKKFQEAQGQLGMFVSRLLSVQEQYPQLKSNENFTQLQAELAGTENRIANERRRFNDVVQAYNTSIRQFPASIVAGFGNFKNKEYFQADQGAKTAPKIDFSKPPQK